MYHEHSRRRSRLEYYDYTRPGFYFVTICTDERTAFFGEIRNNVMVTNELGQTVINCWRAIPTHFPMVELHEYVIMPNHVHGIIQINANRTVGDKVGDKGFCPLQMPWQTKLSRSLGSIIRGFKIGVTKWARQNNQNDFRWQRSFHDHIVRDERSLNKIRRYIVNNPINWTVERNNIPGQFFM